MNSNHLTQVVRIHPIFNQLMLVYTVYKNIQLEVNQILTS